MPRRPVLWRGSRGKFLPISPNDSGTSDAHQSHAGVQSDTGVEGFAAKRRRWRSKRAAKKEVSRFARPRERVGNRMTRRGACRKPRFRRGCAAGCNPAAWRVGRWVERRGQVTPPYGGRRATARVLALVAPDRFSPSVRSSENRGAFRLLLSPTATFPSARESPCGG